MRAKEMTFIAMTVGLISVCSWLTIPYVVPFTMQTFAVFCAVLLLGGKDGTFAVALYIILGSIGLPVFSGFRGGMGHLLGPTGGYILGFVFISLSYLAFEPLIRGKRAFRIPALIIGLTICYLVGTIWFSAVAGLQGKEYSFLTILSMCVLPYIIPDLIKLFLAIFVCDRAQKAISKLDSKP